MDELKIDLLPLKKAALILRAVNHKLRLQILKLIHTHGKLTVTEIYVKLRLEQSVASLDANTRRQFEEVYGAILSLMGPPTAEQ